MSSSSVTEEPARQGAFPTLSTALQAHGGGWLPMDIDINSCFFVPRGTFRVSPIASWKPGPPQSPLPALWPPNSSKR